MCPPKITYRKAGKDRKMDEEYKDLTTDFAPYAAQKDEKVYEFKKKRIGLVIWGSILTGLFFLSLLVFLADYRAGTSVSGTINRGLFFEYILGFVLLLLIPGNVMLVLGIINCVKVSAYNNSIAGKVIDRNLGTYYGRCYGCGTKISAKYRDFRKHKNYPEGFVYGPICRRPCSIKLFEFKEDK